MEVVWTQKAEQDYYDQIDTLLERWNETVAESFVDRVFETIDHIVAHPQMYALTDYRSIRKAVLNKHISLFYRVEEQKIVLLRFWPNQRDPKKLDL